MISTNFKKLVLLGLLAAGLAVVGCGEDEQEQPAEQPDLVECGDKTRLEDGACVPDIDSEPCDEGKVLSIHGNCIDPELFCGNNTVYDNATGDCVDPSTISCGQGTIEVDGQCVVENPVSCGEGTVLADGECLLSEDVCGEGTEFEAPHCHPTADACEDGAQWDVVEGECIHGGSPDCGEQTVESNNQCLPLLSVADELAADADIDHSDGATIVPGTSDAFIFTGTMDDALAHTFSVDASQGQWVEIKIYSRGLPAPGFDLTGAGDWRRTSVPGMASPAIRTVLIPANATYELTVTSSLTDYPDGQDLANDEWQYVGTAQLVSAPTALEWNPMEGPLVGDLRQTKSNFVEVITPGHDQVVLTPAMLGADAEGATLELWSSPTSFDERIHLNSGQSFAIDTSVGSTYLHVDTAAFYGPYAGFAIDGDEPLILQPGQFYETEVFAEAGQLIYLEHINTEAAQVDARVFFQGAMIDEIEGVRAANQSSYWSTEQMREVSYAAQTGFYTVQFINGGTGNVGSFLSQARSKDIPTFHLPEGEFEEWEYTYQGTYQAGDWQYVLIDSPGAAALDLSLSSSSGFVYPRVYAADDRRELYNSTTRDFSLNIPGEGVYWMLARFDSTAGDITFEIAGETVEVIAPGDTYEETFDVAAFDTLTGNITYSEGSAPTVRMTNPNGQLVFEETNVSSGFNLAELFPGPGEFTLQIENTGSQPLFGFKADIYHTPSFETLSSNEAFEETFERPAPLAEGDREALVMQAQSTFALQVAVAAAEEDDIGLTIWRVDGSSRLASTSGEEFVTISIPDLDAGIYIVEIEALTDFDKGYTLSLDGFDIVLVGDSSTPNMEIPNDGGVTSAIDAISLSGCTEIIDLEIDVYIDHWWRGDLTVDIVHPDGTSVRIHNQTGGSANDIIGTYPHPAGPGLEDGEGLLDFVTTSGNGTWQIIVTDVWSGGSDTYGDLVSWGVQLSCAE